MRVLSSKSTLILYFLPVMKPCGHVTCKTCTDSLVHPSKQCIVCDKKLAEKDILELKREGTTIISTLASVLVLTCDLRRHWICRWRYGRDFQEKYCVPRMIYFSAGFMDIYLVFYRFIWLYELHRQASQSVPEVAQLTNSGTNRFVYLRIY